MSERMSRRALLAAILTLAWPTVVEQALQTVVQYADAAMVGQLGAHASACVGLTTTMMWLVNSPLYAMGIGVLAFIARAYGAKDFHLAKDAAVQSTILVVLLGMAEGIITLAISPFLPSWLGAAEELRQEGGWYFAIVCAPMLFRASSIIFASVLRATGDTKTPMYVNLIMNAINIVLNFFLIFSSRSVHILFFDLFLPGAGLGVIGAAIATAISYTVCGILMYLAVRRNPAVSTRGVRIRLDKTIMGPCVRVGLPVALERMCSCMGQVVFSALVTSLGTIPLATHTLALTAEQACYIPGYGMQAAGSTLAGNALGEKNEEKLRRVAKMLMLLAACVMALTGAFFFAFPGPIMSLFTTDAQVIRGGMTVLRIVAVSEPMFAIAIILEGIFNGIGDTRAPFIIALIGMWGVRILGTFVCVHFLHLGLEAVWLCMVADNTTRAILLLARYIRRCRTPIQATA